MGRVAISCDFTMSTKLSLQGTLGSKFWMKTASLRQLLAGSDSEASEAGEQLSARSLFFVSRMSCGSAPERQRSVPGHPGSRDLT
jgi:hypothetical protein